jgi:hypothetical protein
VLRSQSNNISTATDFKGATQDVDKSTTGSTGSNNFAGTSSLPIKNPLSQFNSFNCIFTLGMLTKEQVAYPDRSYRSGEPFSVIIRSGGSGNKKVQTKYEQDLGINAEYFIEDVVIDSIIAPTGNTRLTNATGINFTVKEPYSMGLFLQTIALAAARAGHSNYAKAPYLLTIEFQGFDDEGRSFTIPNTKRYIPISLTGVSFGVTAGGSEYAVEAIPWNEQAFADEIQTIQEDVDLKGNNLAELLQIGELGNESLSYILNRKEQAEEQAETKPSGNKFVIQFPTEIATADEDIFGQRESTSGSTDNVDNVNQTSQRNPVSFESIQNFVEDTDNISEIGRAELTQHPWEEGSMPFGGAEFEQVNPGIFKRGNVTLNPTERRVQFSKGTRIQEIIEELVLLSTYGIQLVDQEPDAAGMKNWFRIETRVYPITDQETEEKRGEPAKVFVYRVVPYKYNAITTSTPTSPTPGIEQLKNNAVKKYDYIYTGENDDIVDFNLEFNTPFYQVLNFDLGQLTQSQKTGGAGQQTQAEETANRTVNDASADNQANNQNEAQPGLRQHTKAPGGEVAGVKVRPETQIARMFNEAIVNSPADLITVSLEIWGDPYYIADSGQGNYTARTSQIAPNITEDGSISYQNGEVDVILNFRTPIDIGKDGFMEFPTLDNEPVSQISGLYKVYTVRNSMSANKFTQTLEMVRRRNQTQEEQDANLLTRETPTGQITDEQRRSGQNG